MTKLQQDFSLWSGDDKTLVINMSDNTTLTNGSFVWVLSNTPTSGSILRLTTDNAAQITISGCSASVFLAASHTAGLSGQYYHEAQLRDSASKVSTVSVGTVTINYDVAGQ